MFFPTVIKVRFLEELNMPTSYLRRFHNEMTTLEDECTFLIPSDKYYIIRLTWEPRNVVDVNDIHEFSKSLLTRITHQPLVVYAYDTEVCLIYSCVDENSKHYRGGDHHALCSEYSVLFAKRFPNVEGLVCRITHFDTQTQVLGYLAWRVYKNYTSTLSGVSQNVSEKDLSSLTLQEVLEKAGDAVNSVTDTQKYGCLFKLRKKKGQPSISMLSEYIDARNMAKYSNFVFGL